MLRRFLNRWARLRWASSSEFEEIVRRVDALSISTHAMVQSARQWHEREDDLRRDIITAFEMADAGVTIPGVPFEVWSEETKEWEAAAAVLEARSASIN